MSIARMAFLANEDVPSVSVPVAPIVGTEWKANALAGLQATIEGTDVPVQVSSGSGSSSSNNSIIWIVGIVIAFIIFLSD
ncbi:MAG: hypothetical protein ABR927_18005 [Bacteroidales bacterium]|jgi:hypothetical protein